MMGGLGIALGAMSTLGGFVTAREAFRLVGRVPHLSPALLYLRGGLAFLSGAFALVLIAVCVAAVMKSARAPRPLELVCLVGIPLELAYQGVDSLFFLLQTSPTSQLKVLVLVQCAVFLGWGAVKCVYYFLTLRQLRRHRS